MPHMEMSDAMDFLRESHVAVLAVATDGSPAAVPLWYAVAPAADRLWIHTPRDSRKGRLLERGRPATLVVQTVTPRLRFVAVDLEVVGHRPTSPDDVRALAGRYLSGDALEGYLEFAEANLAEERYTFRPTRWRFADLTM